MGIYSVTTRELCKENRVLWLPYNGLLDLGYNYEGKIKYIDEFAYEKSYKCLLNNGAKSIKMGEFDVVVYNHYNEQLEKAQKYSLLNHCYTILIQHDLPEYQNDSFINNANEKMKMAHSVYFSSDLAQKKWGLNYPILPPSIKIQTQETKTIDVCLVGSFADEDVVNINKLKSTIPNLIISNGNSISELINIISKSKVCICPTNNIGPEFSMLLAMSYGCCVITNRTVWSEHIIEHGKNGIIFEDFNRCHEYYDIIMKSSSYVEFGQNAQKYITNNFSSAQSLYSTISGVTKQTWKL